MKNVIFKLAVVIFATFLLFEVFTLKDYSINWDEPAHYLRGQAYLHYFLTGKLDYTDIEGANTQPRRSLYQYDDEGVRGKFTYTWYLKNDTGHPPLNGIFASFFNYILYQKLGIVGDIESYHLFTIMASSILVVVIFLFTSLNYGIFSGIISALVLSLFPLFISESHFNIKDPVEATFYTLTVIFFYLGIIHKKNKWILLSGVFAGLALSTKFNIFFSSVSIALWFVIYNWKNFKSLKWTLSKKSTFLILMVPIIAFAILFITWPFLWRDSVKHFISIVNYYKSIGSISYQIGNPIIKKGFFNTYAIQWILYTTPLITLFFSLFGVIKTITSGFDEKNKTSIFVLLWFLVPIARVTMPNAGIYGGVRQIMEFIPPMAILAGIGATYFRDLILKRFKLNTNLLNILILLSFIPITLKLISIHPNENVYFNPLIGGLKGAAARNFPDWGTTLGSVYKQGTDWINQNAEKDSTLTLVKGLLANVPRTQLRKDIKFRDRVYSGDKRKGEYIMEVTDYRWSEDVPLKIREYLNTLTPAFEVKVEDVPILTIWKNDLRHTKSY